MHKRIPTSRKFKRASSKKLWILNQTCYVIRDELITFSDSKNTKPAYCKSGKDELTLQTFGNGLKIAWTPIAEDNFSLREVLFFEREHQQKQIKKAKLDSSTVLNDADVHSDDDDNIGNRLLMEAEQHFFQSGLLK